MIVSDPKIENEVLKMVGREADRLGLECYVIGGAGSDAASSVG